MTMQQAQPRVMREPMSKTMPKTKPLHWLGGFIADLPTPFDDRDIYSCQRELSCQHHPRRASAGNHDLVFRLLHFTPRVFHVS